MAPRRSHQLQRIGPNEGCHDTQHHRHAHPRESRANSSKLILGAISAPKSANPAGWPHGVDPSCTALGRLIQGYTGVPPQSRTEVQQVVDLQYLRRYSRNKVCVSALSTRPVRLRHGEKLNCKAVVAASNGSYSCFFGPFSAHGPTRCTYLVRE